jgi:hypothetical protein
MAKHGDPPPQPARAWAIAATVGLFSLVPCEVWVLVLRVSLRQRVIEAHQQLHGDGLTILPG